MSQCDDILKHLKREGWITPLDALQRYGCFRLAARIAELRQQGHPIETEEARENGKTFARYRYHGEYQRPLFPEENEQ